MTPYALFAIAMLAPVAVVSMASVALRRRQGRVVGRWRVAGAVVSALFSAGSALAVAGWALPDALDRMPAHERGAVGPALRASPECGLVPFARVLSVEVQGTADDGPTLRYTCGVTPLGLPRFSNEATCVDGSWRGPGALEPWSAGSC